MFPFLATSWLTKVRRTTPGAVHAYFSSNRSLPIHELNYCEARPLSLARHQLKEQPRVVKVMRRVTPSSGVPHVLNSHAATSHGSGARLSPGTCCIFEKTQTMLLLTTPRDPHLLRMNQVAALHFFLDQK